MDQPAEGGKKAKEQKSSQGHLRSRDAGRILQNGESPKAAGGRKLADSAADKGDQRCTQPLTQGEAERL